MKPPSLPRCPTYPGCVLIIFLCDYDNKQLLFFQNLADISVLLIFAIIEIW